MQDNKLCEEKKEESNYEILPDDYPKYDLAFKIIVIGNSGVGKSCLSVKATKNIFENNYLATVGFEFFNFNIKLDGKIIKLQIWDTCGQEIYRSLITNFYRNSSLAVIVYAINDAKSFQDIEIWLKELKIHSNPDIKIFLIGNKNDLVDCRQVSFQQAQAFKEDFNLSMFMETSAKTGFHAKEIFIEAAKQLYYDYNKYKQAEDEKRIKLPQMSEQNPEEVIEKRRCCS